MVGVYLCGTFVFFGSYFLDQSIVGLVSLFITLLVKFCLNNDYTTKTNGSQTPTSCRDPGSPSKQWTTGSRTRFGTSGASGSNQRGDSSTPDVSKFRPNSATEAHFNRSFKSRPLFVFGVLFLRSFSRLLSIYTLLNGVGNALLCLRELPV